MTPATTPSWTVCAMPLAHSDFSATTGLPLRQQWSLTKHRWLVDNVPSARSAVRRLNVAEWIVRGLGGDEATEQSLASRTGWLRLASGSWWERHAGLVGGQSVADATAGHRRHATGPGQRRGRAAAAGRRGADRGRPRSPGRGHRRRRRRAG